MVKNGFSVAEVMNMTEDELDAYLNILIEIHEPKKKGITYKVLKKQ